MNCAALCLALLVLMTSDGVAQGIPEDPPADTMVVELDQSVIVVGWRITSQGSPFPFAKEQLGRVLSENGFHLIKKGVFLAQDIHADGFKRDDITIVVDGERYHSACPNRMDSPLARSNPLEMTAIELNKTSSACCSGLGGSIAYRRAPIGHNDQLLAGVSQSLGGYEASDVGFSGTTRQHRLAGRYATGSGYTDGEGQSFVDRYGYRQDFDYRLAEASLAGEYRDVQYRSEFTYTDNVMFPYLHMDERLNRVISGHVSYGGHKLYANFTDHVMDNGLRQSNMSMVTDATNLTVGLTGPAYELYYRYWNADNKIVTPMATITNDLMPSVTQFAAAAFYEHSDREVTWWGRLGISRFGIGEDKRVSFYQKLCPGQTTSRAFLTLGAGVAHRATLGSSVVSLVALDMAAEPPSAQSLYIAVQRPMGKAWWVGNPGLRSPVRTSLRSKLKTDRVTAEGSVSYVWDYVDLVPESVGGQAYKTYANFDAIMLSLNLRAEWRYWQGMVGYTWSERVDEGRPLAEIAPFYASYTITSSLIYQSQLFWRHTYNDAQTRIDRDLYETATGSWQRVDIGLTYDLPTMRLSFEIENLFDALYTQHLSYLRDPFASGKRVFEPGRSVRLTLVLDTPKS